MSDFTGFPRQTLTFLRGLSANNEREWFRAHRDDYERYWLEPAQDFVEAVAGPLRRIGKDLHAEARVNGSIFRINRDIRFTKDKTPYKDHLDLWFWEGDRAAAVSGYFFRLTTKTLTLGAGSHGLAGDRLGAFRRAVVDSAAPLRRALSAVDEDGWQVMGERYKKLPRGFEAGDEVTDRLLRHDALFVVSEERAAPMVHTAEIVDHCIARWRTAAPIHRWLVANVE